MLTVVAAFAFWHACQLGDMCELARSMRPRSQQPVPVRLVITPADYVWQGRAYSSLDDVLSVSDAALTKPVILVPCPCVGGERLVATRDVLAARGASAIGFGRDPGPAHALCEERCTAASP